MRIALLVSCETSICDELTFTVQLKHWSGVAHLNTVCVVTQYTGVVGKRLAIDINVHSTTVILCCISSLILFVGLPILCQLQISLMEVDET